MMSLVELDTAVRLGLGMVVVVYNDSAYGAEVHHFEHETTDLDIVKFPETDIAAIARGSGCEGITVRSIEDLAPVTEWLSARGTSPWLLTPRSPSLPLGCSPHSFEGRV